MAKHSEPFTFRTKPDGELKTIPPSQAATMARYFVANRNRWVNWDDLYRAIGSHEVSRCLNQLRHKWGLPIAREDVPKVEGRGTRALYRIADGVEEVK